MINISEVLKTLAAKRPLFHSEADFQHAFAWEIHERLKDSAIRLEIPFQGRSKTLHLDVWAVRGSEILAVELKYKTRGLALTVNDEQYDLKDQSAQDIGRYDFVKDIERLEQVVLQRKDITAYAILLTNDGLYWARPMNDRTVDADFRLQQGRTLHGTLRWGEGASTGTTKNREQPIQLKGHYEVDWQDYYRTPATRYGTFRYIAVKVQG